LTFVEWDEATTPGFDTSGYSISDGSVLVPDMPGFGLTLDEEIFQRAVRETGFAFLA
jgi:L-alanine-DL-glutamate epimerase-like enolase superfamily enzyme